MRVLMVLDHPYPPDIRVENEARTLVEAGHEVTLLQISPDDRPEVDDHEGTRIVRRRIPRRAVNWLRGFAGVTPLMDLYLDREIRKEFAARPFDAIHVHDLYLVGGGLRAGRRLNVPVVADLHENWVEALQHYAWSTRPPGRWVVRIPKWEAVERRWVRAADHLVVPIEEARDRYLSLGVARDRVHVVPNTVELESFDAYPIRPDIVSRTEGPLTLVYTGFIDAHRGVQTVVEAMPTVLARHPEARLVIVGSGSTVHELETQVEQLGLGSRVAFEGYVPQDHIKSYLAGASIALVPHLKTPHTDNTIPHKLFHAMRVGTPVLVSDCAPLKRIVEAERCGEVFASGDPADFARAVGALADPATRERLGARGREAVQARYNWDATVEPLRALYRQLAASVDRTDPLDS